MFKRYFEKYNSDIEILKEQLNEQQKKLDFYNKKIIDITDENKRLKRILENYIPGKITYQNMSEYLTVFSINRNEWCYLYKDGKEFCINNIELNNPSFTEINDGDQKNIIYVKDDITTDGKIEYRKYIINLNNCTFIREK